MLIFLPVHRSTPGLDGWPKAILKHGKLSDHSLMICSTRADEDLAYQLGDAVADNFKKVSTMTLPVIKRPGFTLANDMFKAALTWLQEYKNETGEVADPPLLYLDPTFRPAARNWVDELQSEYFLKNAPPVMARTSSTGSGPTFRRLTIGPVILGKTFKPELLNHPDPKQHWRERLIHELAKDCVETRQIGPGGKSLLKQANFAKTEA